jgi:hypothetical protein
MTTKGNISDEACPQQDRLMDAANQQRVNCGRANHSIRVGEGQCYRIDASGVTVGGGRATGAPMNLRDLRNFSGTVEG